MIHKRRREEGFCQPVSSQQWAATSVRRHLEEASCCLIQNCCDAEWKELAADPHPEDDDLEGALQSISRALNGLMTFSEEVSIHSEEPLSLERQEPDHKPAAVPAQDANSQAATDYVHWLMEADPWLQEYRANIPRALTEKEMVDFLLSPLSQVLSFQDFHDVGLCPLTTQGRVTLIKQWETPKSAPNEAEQEFIRRGKVSLNTLISEFAVELDTPDGDTIPLSIRRFGEPSVISYGSWLFDAMLSGDWEKLTQAGGFRTEGGIICFHEGSLGDRDSYPTFPQFTFTGYPKSICSEAYALNITLRENELYARESAALRFLLMRVSSPSYGVQYYRDSIFAPQWQGSMETRTVLTIPNWLLPDDLANYWRQVRPKAARQRRLPSAENVELFRYVLQNTSPGTEPQWASLACLWSDRNGIVLTRDKLFKVYQSVRDALFPGHPSRSEMKRLEKRNEEFEADEKAYLADCEKNGAV